MLREAIASCDRILAATRNSKKTICYAGVSLGELCRRQETENHTITLDSSYPGGNFKAGRNVLEPFKARIRQECPQRQILKPHRRTRQLGAYALAAVPAQQDARPNRPPNAQTPVNSASSRRAKSMQTKRGNLHLYSEPFLNATQA